MSSEEDGALPATGEVDSAATPAGGLTETVLGLPGGAQPPSSASASAHPVAGHGEAHAKAAAGASSGKAVADGYDVIADLLKRIERREGSDTAGRLLEAYVETMSKELRTLSARVDRLAQNLSGTVGYRLRETFQCDSCGAKGHVAGRIVCTGCQKESWWGWWPEG